MGIRLSHFRLQYLSEPVVFWLMPTSTMVERLRDLVKYAVHLLLATATVKSYIKRIGALNPITILLGGLKQQRIRSLPTYGSWGLVMSS